MSATPAIVRELRGPCVVIRCEQRGCGNRFVVGESWRRHCAEHATVGEVSALLAGRLFEASLMVGFSMRLARRLPMVRA